MLTLVHCPTACVLTKTNDVFVLPSVVLQFSAFLFLIVNKLTRNVLERLKAIALVEAPEKLCNEDEVEEDNDNKNDLNEFTYLENAEDLPGSKFRRRKVISPKLDPSSTVNIFLNESRTVFVFISPSNPESKNPINHSRLRDYNFCLLKARVSIFPSITKIQFILSMNLPFFMIALK